MKKLMLLALVLMPMSAHAHMDSPDRGLHHGLPVFLGLLPLLKVWWDQYLKRFLQVFALLIISTNAFAHGDGGGDPAWYGVGLNLVIIAMLYKPSAGHKHQHAHKHEHE